MKKGSSPIGTTYYELILPSSLTRYSLFKLRVYTSGKCRIINRIRKSRFSRKANITSCCLIYKNIMQLEQLD